MSNNNSFNNNNNNDDDLWSTLYDDVIASNEEELDGTLHQLEEYNYSRSAIIALLNRQDENGRTLLHHALTGNDEANVWVVSRLLEAGADPNIADNEGVTPLMDAAVHNQLQVVERYILEPSMDPFIQDADGKTARELAIDFGMEDIALALEQAEFSMTPARRTRVAPMKKTKQTRIPGGKRHTKRHTKKKTKRSAMKRKTARHVKRRGTRRE